MARRRRSDDPDKARKPPVPPPDPRCYPGYAEEVPRTKEQAQKPGGMQAPDSEAGHLEHDPDPLA